MSLKRSPFPRPEYVRPPRAPLTRAVRQGTYSTSGGVAAVPKERALRSEAYRRYVASQECFACRLEGFSQCAHENVGKGLGLKVCDSRTFPACAPHHGLMGCHQQFDLLVDMDRSEAREMGAKYVAEMRARARAAGWRFTDTEILKP